jgi:endoglucanase
MILTILADKSRRKFAVLYIKAFIKAYTKLILTVSFFSWMLNATSQAPFNRGINLTGWFQVDYPGQIQFTKFTHKDLADIKSLGCDVVRLPVNLHAMTSGEPHYYVDRLFLSFLDSVADWCEQLELYLIIDNHSFDPNVDTQPNIVNILVKVWAQMASHYKDRSEYILYEILNEPHGISSTTWGEIQQQAINAIRAVDKKHTIIVGGSGYNTYTELKNLPHYTDNNLLYTFHFYDPFIFTHQGASWVNPSMVPLSGVPFPYSSADMPACPPALKGTWIESNINSYPAQGNVEKVRSLINNAISFRNSRDVNIYCGEFGVFIPNSPPDDRVLWYNTVKLYLEENNIPWTIWDYKGGFGLFNKNSWEMFGHDLNIDLLESLGLNVPVQTPYSRKPDSTGFMIYTDFVAQKITDATYSTGAVSFYSDNLPNNQNYCLFWNGFSRYNALVFDFIPDRDLSALVDEGYAINFMVRGNKPGISFDIRFRDTDTDDPDDHPWRIGATVNDYLVSWDNKWHNVHIPLASLNESGAWDDNTWFNPEGKYDWSSVDCFEISIEEASTSGQLLWFDNIHITNMDTAIVRENIPVEIRDIMTGHNTEIRVSPNPVKDYTRITFELPAQEYVNIMIYSLAGQTVRNLASNVYPPGIATVYWDGCSDNGAPLPRGLYLIRVRSASREQVCKIMKD